MLAKFRPRVRSAQLKLNLPVRVENPRIARALPVSADRVAHLVNLTDPRLVDRQLCQWLDRGVRLQPD